MVSEQKCWFFLYLERFCVFLDQFEKCSSIIRELFNILIWIFMSYLSFLKNLVLAKAVTNEVEHAAMSMLCYVCTNVYLHADC